jgi:hypothetical protein
LGFGATKGALSTSTLVIVFLALISVILSLHRPALVDLGQSKHLCLRLRIAKWSQLENDILPLAPDTADVSAVALLGLCVALEALVAV